jgi:hypothetical protein
MITCPDLSGRDFVLTVFFIVRSVCATKDANEKLTVPFLHKSREQNANDSPIAHNIVAEHPSTRRLNRHE